MRFGDVQEIATVPEDGATATSSPTHEDDVVEIHAEADLDEDGRVRRCDAWELPGQSGAVRALEPERVDPGDDPRVRTIERGVEPPNRVNRGAAGFDRHVVHASSGAVRR
jgi:hypothetical protein